MRPVMGAPDDIPFIHGLVDQVERLSETLVERNAEIKMLKEVLDAREFEKEKLREALERLYYARLPEHYNSDEEAEWYLACEQAKEALGA